MLGLAAVLFAGAVPVTLTPSRLLVFLAAAVIGSRAKVNIFGNSTLSLLTSVVLLAVISEGLGVAMLVAIMGVTAQVILPSRKFAVHQLAFNLGMITLTVTATWLTHQWIAVAAPLSMLPAQVTATLLASFSYFLGNSISVSLIIGLTKGISMFSVWLDHFLHSAPSFLMAGLLSLGVGALMTSAGMAILLTATLAVALAYYSSVRVVAQPAAGDARS
jgi:hypothetical protein